MNDGESVTMNVGLQNDSKQEREERKKAHVGTFALNNRKECKIVVLARNSARIDFVPVTAPHIPTNGMRRLFSNDNEMLWGHTITAAPPQHCQLCRDALVASTGHGFNVANKAATRHVSGEGVSSTFGWYFLLWVRNSQWALIELVGGSSSHTLS